MNLARAEEIQRDILHRAPVDVVSYVELTDLLRLAIQTLKTRDKARKRMAKVRRKAKGGGR